MKNNIVIMNFSGVYEVQGLKAVLEAGKTNNHIISQLDCQDIPGTNCYCDSLAEEEIEKRIVPFGPEGLHFLDSGNYHYLTKLQLPESCSHFSFYNCYLFLSNCFDLAKNTLWKRLNCYAASSWLRSKVLSVYFVECCEITHIC